MERSSRELNGRHDAEATHVTYAAEIPPPPSMGSVTVEMGLCAVISTPDI